MSRYKRIFRVFISSTFDDLIAERNVLHAEVFPAIREYCTERNCQFQPFDLGGGTRRKPPRNNLTMGLCFAETARCQSVTPGPTFLITRGNRYGWRPIPATVEASDFE